MQSGYKLHLQITLIHTFSESLQFIFLGENATRRCISEKILGRLKRFQIVALKDFNLPQTLASSLYSVLLRNAKLQVLNEIEKKAAMSSYDTNGKKAYVFEYPQDYEKRLLTLGFQGAREKMKDFPAEWEKRAPMGFQGMRGKKALLDEIEELEKRALMGFQVS